MIASRKISEFIKNLVRLHVVNKDLDLSYKQMSEDTERGDQALEWAEAT